MLLPEGVDVVSEALASVLIAGNLPSKEDSNNKGARAKKNDCTRQKHNFQNYCLARRQKERSAKMPRLAMVGEPNATNVGKCSSLRSFRSL